MIKTDITEKDAIIALCTIQKQIREVNKELQRLAKKMNTLKDEEKLIIKYLDILEAANEAE